MIGRLSALAAAVAVAACASTGQAPGSTGVDPTGDFTFLTTVQGTPVDGRMRIGGAPGAYTGSVYTDLTGELPLSSVRVEGHHVLLTADTRDGPIEIRLLFEGDEFTGDWTAGADGGKVRGRRIRE